VGVIIEDLYDHEGYGVRRLPDGTLTATWSAETAAFDAYVAACGCGWHGGEHPPTDDGYEAAVDQWEHDHARPLLAKAVPIAVGDGRRRREAGDREPVPPAAGGGEAGPRRPGRVGSPRDPCDRRDSAADGSPLAAASPATPGVAATPVGNGPWTRTPGSRTLSDAHGASGPPPPVPHPVLRRR
jgi:hypothetical protein